MNNDELIAGFIAYKTIEVGLSDITLETYQHILREFCLSIGESDPAGAGETEIRAYIAGCWDRGVQPSTVRQQISCFTGVFQTLAARWFHSAQPDDSHSNAEALEEASQTDCGR